MNKRYIGLDIFRIMSCVIVCAYHTTIHLGCDYGLLNSVSTMGAVFMTAFFMLSSVSLHELIEKKLVFVLKKKALKM